MAKTEYDEDVELMSPDGPHNEPVTIWLTEKHKNIYEWLRDEKKIKAAQAVKKVINKRLEELAARYGYPGDPAA